MTADSDINFGVAALGKMSDRDLNNIIDKVLKTKKGASALKSMMRSVMRSALKSTIKSATKTVRGRAKK
jgi:hypothetical protein